MQLEYSKQDTVSTSSAGSDAPDAMKIVHKEQDQLMCFCLNQVKVLFKADYMQLFVLWAE